MLGPRRDWTIALRRLMTPPSSGAASSTVSIWSNWRTISWATDYRPLGTCRRLGRRRAFHQHAARGAVDEPVGCAAGQAVPGARMSTMADHDQVESALPRELHEP